MKFRGAQTLVITAAVVTVLAVCALAKQEAPSLDDLLNIGAEKNPQRSPAPIEPDRRAMPIDPDVQRELNAQDAANQFERAIELMDEASQRLGIQLDPGLATQRVQESVLQKLDTVIAQERRRRQSGSKQCSGSKKQDEGNAANEPRQGQATKPGTQAHQGQASPGQVGPVDPDKTPLGQLRRQWGHLPTHLRDELWQGLNEPFSPVYRLLTESYYRRLAEQGKPDQ